MEKYLTMVTLTEREDGVSFVERKAVIIRETDKMVMVIFLDDDGNATGMERKILKRKLDVVTDNSEGTHYVSMKAYAMTDEGVEIHKAEMLRRLKEHLAATKAKVAAIEALLSDEG